MSELSVVGRLMPGQAVPALDLRLSDGSHWSSDQITASSLSLLAIYRGGWCADCRRFVTGLDQRVGDLRALGIEAAAVSVEETGDLVQTIQDWSIKNLILAGSLDPGQARRWGLYASSLVMHGEERFCFEPGLFLIRPDQTLYAMWLQTLPSARPDLDWLIETLRYLSSHNFPLRGAD